DATSLRKIVDQTVIADVAVLEPTLAGDERVDVAWRQLTLPQNRDRCALGQAHPRLLVFLEVLDRAADVLVDWDAIPLDLVIAVHEPGHVLGAVLARLGREEPQPAIQLNAHPAREAVGIALDRVVE